MDYPYKMSVDRRNEQIELEQLLQVWWGLINSNTGNWQTLPEIMESAEVHYFILPRVKQLHIPSMNDAYTKILRGVSILNHSIKVTEISQYVNDDVTCFLCACFSLGHYYNSHIKPAEVREWMKGLYTETHAELYYPSNPIEFFNLKSSQMGFDLTWPEERPFIVIVH